MILWEIIGYIVIELLFQTIILGLYKLIKKGISIILKLFSFAKSN
jgi:hypothetical protein